MLSGLILHLLILSGSYWCAFLVVVRFDLARPGIHRVASATVIHVWLLQMLFWLLAGLGAFSVQFGSAAVFSLAIVLNIVWGRSEATKLAVTHDTEAVRSVLTTLRRPWVGILTLAVGIVVFAMFLRGLLAPPLAWDSLTYHLVKSARWVQSGAYDPLLAPGATLYYAYFPSGGEILWAWSMVTTRTDALLGWASLHTVGATGILLYASARLFDASRRNSALWATSILTLPAVLAYVTTMYVDMLHMSFLLFALAGIVRCVNHRDPQDLVVVMASLGTAAAIKISTLPYALVVIGLGLIVATRSSADRSFLTGRTGLLGVALGVALPGYVLSWIGTGSPTYPVGVDLGPLGTWTGNEEFEKLFAAQLRENQTFLSFGQILAYLFVFTLPGWNHLNFGFGGAVLAITGIWGWLRSVTQHDAWLPAALMSGFVLIGLLPFVQAGTAVFRTETWAPVSGRLFLVPFACLALIGTRSSSKAVPVLFVLAIVLNLLQAIPAGWGNADSAAFGEFAPWLGFALLLGAGSIVLFKETRWRRTAAAVASIALLTFVFPLDDIRQRHRYAYYQESSYGAAGVFAADHLEPYFASAWKIWKVLDQDEPLRVAVTAGWDGYGHNWYWYPLLGSRLQNDLFYVPVTRTGELVDYRLGARVDSLADPDAWMARLKERRTDMIALLAPPGPEAEWMASRPSLFEKITASDDGLSVLYRFHGDDEHRPPSNE